MPSTLPTWSVYAAAVPFRLGVLTNEISDDLQRALAVARDLGISDIELNTLWGQQITDLDEAALQRVRSLLDEHGMRASLITDAAGKSLELKDIPEPGATETVAYRRHRQILERAIAAAHALGTDRVRLFAFKRPMKGIEAGTPGWRPSAPPTEAELATIRRGMLPLCDLARREGVTLLIENVRYSFADTGAHSRAILDAVDAANLQVIWDPANAYISGEARHVPDGYAAVRPAIGQVHLKDARFTDKATGATAWARIGDGEVDLAGQLAALVRDGYDGVASLETHWRLPGDKGEQSTLETWRVLSGMLDQIARSGMRSNDA